jgi:HSP20 family protein
MASRFFAPLPVARGWLPDPVFQLQREIDRVFEDVFSSGAGSGNGGRSGQSLMNAPRIDLQDADGELRLHADLPGVAPKDLDIRVEGDVLTIRGERKSENERREQNYHVMERSHGRFQRSVQLPFSPDPQEVQASMHDGVLELRIPKHAPQERSRRIEVRDSGGNAGSSAGAGGSGSNTGASGESGANTRGSVAGAVGGDGHSGSGASSGSSGSTASSGSGGSAGQAGSTGQGPGGSSSVTPGVGGAAAGGKGGGLAGTAGGPTAAPAGETSAAGKSPSSTH